MIINVKEFSLDKTIEAGHTFIWQKYGDHYVSYLDFPARLKQLDNGALEVNGISDKKTKELLGLTDNINEINAEIDKDNFIDRAINYSSGIRVVKEGIWTSTLAFVLSIQSNVPLIKRRIAALSKEYGKYGEIGGDVVYQFPNFEKIFSGGIEKLKKFKLGFRTKFVFSASEFFHNNLILDEENFDILRSKLINIQGVGEKVLDCIMLYGAHDLSAFPMDVWIKRVLSTNYGTLLHGLKSYKNISKAITDYFGKYGGYAQLYMYNYSRMNKLK